MELKNYFYQAGELFSKFLTGSEVAFFSLEGEDSSFTRFSGGKVRQTGEVF